MAQCWDWHPDTNTARKLSDVWVQCPSGSGCCIGSDDCLDYNLCKSLGSSNNANNDSGYYVQRCTDPLYTDPACQKVCSAPGPPDAVYNSSAQLWACCGDDADGKVSCNAPTDEVFQAPAIAQLSVLSSSVPTVSTETLIPGSATSATSSLTSSSSSSATASASSSPASDGLSTGAQAGIGVGVAVVALALLGILAFMFVKRRKSRNSQGYEQHAPVEAKGSIYHPTEKGLDNDTRRQELLSTGDNASYPGHARSTTPNTYYNQTTGSHQSPGTYELDAR